jgi:hypothetical protein
MPLYTPTFNDATPAANLAGQLRRIAVGGVPTGDRFRRGVIRDDVSDAAAGMANKGLEVLRDMGAAGLADWLVMRLSQEPDDLFAAMAQRRFIEALLDARLVVSADLLDTGELWTETDQNAPATPVSAPRRGVPWAPREPGDGERRFTARVSSPQER